MKYLFSCILSVVFAFFGITIFMFSASGVQAQTGGVVSAPSEEVTPGETAVAPAVSRPFFFADQRVVLADAYAGPVFVGAGEGEVSGQIDGDLIVGAGSIRITGTIAGDLYVAGGTVLMNGQVAGNVIAAGGEVQFGESAVVGESVIVGGENVILNGDIGSQVYVGARRATFQGNVQGDAFVQVENLIVTETAAVQNISGESSQPVEQSENASVSGAVSVSVVERQPSQSPSMVVSWFTKTVFTLIGFVILMTLGMWLFSSKLAALAVYAREAWQQSLTTGVLVYTSLGLGGAVLILTIFGWKAGVSLLAILMALATVSWLVPAVLIGQKLLPDQKILWQGLLGAVLAAVLVSLPVVGWLIGMILALWGAGAFVRLSRTGA